MSQPHSPPQNKNALTFNVIIMFLFYVLSTTICLSSFSTCICVVFNPVGTFLTISTYLFYALGLSVSLTFLFVALSFDKNLLPEERREREMGEEGARSVGEKQAVVDAESIRGIILHHEVSAPPQEMMVNATPTPVSERRRQCEGSALLQGGSIQATLIRSASYCELSALRQFENETTLAATSHSSSSSSEQRAALEDDGPDSMQHIDHAPHFCDELSALLSDMMHAAEKAAAPEALATETAAGPASASTPRESRRVEKWMSRTNVADCAHDTATGFNGTQEGDDDTDADTTKDDEETVGMTAWGLEDRGARSTATGSVVSVDSDFQNALRKYMGKGVKDGSRRKGSGDSTTPSEGSSSSAESEFQGEVRKMFMFGKVGGKRRARSV